MTGLRWFGDTELAWPNGDRRAQADAYVAEGNPKTQAEAYAYATEGDPKRHRLKPILREKGEFDAAAHGVDAFGADADAVAEFPG
jgi:hypothetical protein